MTPDPSASDPFATAPDRRRTGSEKWDRWQGRDVVPAWVADMDFRTADVILDAIRTRVDHGVFGYTADTPGFAPALAGHLERLHGWRIDPEHVMGTPGVVTGLALAARLLSSTDDEIITFTPVYPPFLTLPKRAGRRTVSVPLVRSGNTWVVDFDALAAAATPRSRLLWLCHPHNPTGSVFDRTTLLHLADFAAARDIVVVSDEIWSDLVLDADTPHVPFASLDHPAARRSVTLLAPSKTWNLAGLSCAAAILPDAEWRRSWRAAGKGLVPMVNPLGYAAAEAAWTHGEPWRLQLLDVLRRHRTLALESVRRIPGLHCIPPQATYLVWIDCRDSGVAHPCDACISAGVGPSEGGEFGAPGFIRLNMACPTTTFTEVLRRLARAFPAA